MQPSARMGTVGCAAAVRMPDSCWVWCGAALGAGNGYGRWHDGLVRCAKFREKRRLRCMHSGATQTFAGLLSNLVPAPSMPWGRARPSTAADMAGGLQEAACARPPAGTDLVQHCTLYKQYCTVLFRPACKPASRSPAAARTSESGSQPACAPSRSLPPAAHLI